MTSRQTAVAVRPADERFARKAGLLALAVSLLLVGLRYLVVEVPQGDFAPGEKAFVRHWDPPRTKLDTILDAGDAQVWAALGRDPTLSHPEAFYGGLPEYTYRLQRPLPGWLIWGISFGQPDLVGPALILVTCAGLGVLVWAAARAAAAFGRRPEHGALVAVLPGSVSTVLGLGPDILVTGFAVAGVTWWYQDTPRHRAIAMAFFLAATFGRETLFLVPLIVAAHSLVRARARLVSVLPLAIPAVAIASWVTLVYVRYGFWPSEVNKAPRFIEGVQVTNNMTLPFVGIVQAAGVLDLMAWATIATVLVCLVIALARDRGSVLTWCALGLLPIGIFAGAWVWALEPQRAFLPIATFSLLAALPFRVRSARRSPTVTAAT